VADRDPTVAVSSWSLHRTIGLSWWESPDRPAARAETWGTGTLPILDLPAAVAARGIRRLHLCHFHVESRDPGWTDEFRGALRDAGVRLSMLLIDDGDIAHPTEHARHVAWVGGLIVTAAALGAESARVIAGKQRPTPEALALSARGLRQLSAEGRSLGVRIVTENWLDLTPGPDEIDYLMDSVGDDLGLLADFGNWSGPAKYTDLARVLPRAEDVHAKASFSPGGAIDAKDFGRCIDLAVAAGYDGPYTLIFDAAKPDEWAGIETERRFLLDRVSAASGTPAMTA
jgi:sugar phosphate isomerase/epimerase